MNTAHLHLILVHVPIVLVPLSTILFAIAQWRKVPAVRTCALLILQGATLFAIAAFLLGEGAEETVEHALGVVESAIEPHEDAATVALWLTCITGVLSAAYLGCQKYRPQALRLIGVSILIFSVLSTASLAFTAQQGGKIRHPEAFNTASNGHQETQTTVNSKHERDDD